jgi:hypothetical protein
MILKKLTPLVKMSHFEDTDTVNNLKMFRNTGAQFDTMFENFDQKRPSCDLTRQIALVEA